MPRRALRASGVILRHDALIWDTGCTQAMHYKPPSKGKMTESNIRDHKSVYQGFGKGENMTMESHVQATVTYLNGMIMHDSARMDECVDSLGNAWTSRNGTGKKEGFGTWIDNSKGQSYVMQGNSGDRFELIDVEDQPVVGHRIQKVEIEERTR